MSRVYEPGAIAPGSRITLHYSLRLEDGTVVDSSQGDEALSFVLGDGTLIAGLETLLLGMRAGQQQVFAVAPEQAFGYRDPANVHTMPRGDFAAELPLEPGTILSFAAPAGDEIPGTILALTATEVTVDFNHPLAGHTLSFAVEIIATD